MDIKDELVVKVEDATFYFEIPSPYDFKEATRLQKDGQESDDNDFIFSRLKKIENVNFKGEAVTPDTVREVRLPLTFITILKRQYWEAFREAMGIKSGEEKNEKGS